MQEHTSYSSTLTLMQCGLKYKLMKLDGHTERAAWWSVAGSAAHSATEAFDLTGEGTAADLFAAAFDDHIETTLKFDPDKDEWRQSRNQGEEWWRLNGPPMVQAYIDWRQESGWEILDADGTPAVELPILIDMGPLDLKGFIDRVFVTPAGEVVVLDLKFGARKPDSALQLGWYRVGLEKQYGVTSDLGAYYLPRKVKPEDRLIVHPLERYTEKFVGHFIKATADALDKELFLPNPSGFCGSCGVRDACWVWADDTTK